MLTPPPRPRPHTRTRTRTHTRTNTHENIVRGYSEKISVRQNTRGFKKSIHHLSGIFRASKSRLFRCFCCRCCCCFVFPFCMRVQKQIHHPLLFGTYVLNGCPNKKYKLTVVNQHEVYIFLPTSTDVIKIPTVIYNVNQT